LISFKCFVLSSPLLHIVENKVVVGKGLAFPCPLVVLASDFIETRTCLTNCINTELLYKNESKVQL